MNSTLVMHSTTSVAAMPASIYVARTAETLLTGARHRVMASRLRDMDSITGACNAVNLVAAQVKSAPITDVSDAPSRTEGLFRGMVVADVRMDQVGTEPVLGYPPRSRCP